MTNALHGYHGDLLGAARAGDDFRRVLATTDHAQLVLMTLAPGEEIGSEVHHGVDQLLLVAAGAGESVVDGQRRPFGEGHAVLIPAGAEHNIVNTGAVPLRLVSLYGPAEHPPGTIHPTKADADRAEHDEPATA
ncbi:cupin [Pilimelia anulata]|uniref:Cupin n=1 Tax=Pilimelia anulata TaxID=53371 RepID=A0A8J3BBH4_9ACTN|nr:cupin domain-containing protein [Pilimelia anulata]GGK02871.1 cupin [Pilimelia anulata]